MSTATEALALGPMPPKLDKQGRKSVRMQIVLPPTLLDLVEEWRAKQRPVPNVSEAIRRLVEKAIKDETK